MEGSPDAPIQTPLASQPAPSPSNGFHSAIIPWFLAISFAIALGITFFTWKSQVAALNQDVDRLAQQVKARNDELVSLRAQYNKTVEEANSRLEAARQQVKEANTLQVEVQVGFRKAFFNSGSVLAVKSIASSPMAIRLLIERPATGASKSFETTIDPGQVKEIGAQEGWAFVSGDVIRVEAPERKGLKFVAP